LIVVRKNSFFVINADYNYKIRSVFIDFIAKN